MYNKRQHLNLILVSVAICGFPGTAAWAKSVSVPSGLSINSPSAFLAADGSEPDANTTTKIKVWLDTPDRTTLDLGAGESDFLFDMPDKTNHGRYDNAGDTHEPNFEAIKSADSRHSGVTPGNDKDIRLGGANRDGERDASAWFDNKSGSHVCPTLTTVPLPGSLLFFGSGLLGLAATLRSGRRT